MRNDNKAVFKSKPTTAMMPSAQLILMGAMTIALVFADQWSKLAAYSNLSSPREIFSGLSLKYAENTGIAWSISVPFGLLIAANVLLMAFFLLWAATNLDYCKNLSVAATSLVIAGAIGNLIDRIRLGYVIDFIAAWFWPVFNLADAFLSVGIFLILVFYAKINKRG
jgi:signal peptidase II